MAHIYVSRVIDASIDQVWAVARDFTGNWHSSVIADASIEDGKRSDEVGCVREFAMANGGGRLREQLVTLSDEDHTFAYRILDSPLPVTDYHSVVRFRPVTESGATFGEWTVDFRVAPDDEDEVVGMVTGVFRSGLDDIAKLTES